MLQRMYKGLDQNVFTTNRQPEPIIYIEDLEVYNEKKVWLFPKKKWTSEESRKDLGFEADRPEDLFRTNQLRTLPPQNFRRNVYHRRCSRNLPRSR